MTLTSTEQPEALRLAKALEAYWCVEIGDIKDAAKELRAQHARILELEAAQAQRAPLPNYNHTHQYRPHPKYPWFCEACGYAKHEQLMHGITQEKQG